MASHSLPVASTPNIRVWDLPLRLFHWLLAASVTIAFLSADGGSPLDEWHMISGWVAAILIVFRLVWGFVGGEHARFSSFVRPAAARTHVAKLLRGRARAELGHNPLGGLSVLLLILLVAVTVVTGAAGKGAEEIHELLAYALLAFIGVHIFAVLAMSALTHENLVRAMVTGTKVAARHPSARHAAPPHPSAVALAAIAVLAALFVVLRYDPQAFQLRPIEEAEHGGVMDDERGHEEHAQDD